MADEPDNPEDDLDEIEESDDSAFTSGDMVVSIDCPEARISVAVPVDTDPNLVGKLLDLAVGTVWKIRTQMQ